LTDIVRLEPNPANECFGCGGDNPGGMKLRFEQDIRIARSWGDLFWANGIRAAEDSRMAESLQRCSMKPWARSAAFARHAR